MKYSYYPGCSLESSSKNYDRSVQAVYDTLGLELIELDDWNCCGATYYMSIKETISLVFSARNLAIAESLGRDLVAPCSSCYTILYKTNKLLNENPIMRAKVRQALKRDGLDYQSGVQVRHPLEVLVNDVGLEKISLETRRHLEGIKVAPYYGCQIVRPERGLDDCENPRLMDELFASVGAEIVNFPMKVRCCGGMLMTTYPDVALKLNKELLESATVNGAECIVTTCPLCQINLEGYQKKINARFHTNFRIPILFFSQLLGWALGCDPDALGLNQNLIGFSKIKQKVLQPA
ncbi:MAG: CoB--CoM heterodisulfide reductase iron-sulfur subunit B family protein [Fidelibacterota bacterium]|nr:MAG: CoB--CoM heterodisulfide reductase iron-sulfur subunit B family protein [Candidatus Neomarinimicrobiota bacterium]